MRRQSFATIIRNARHEQGLSQLQLARHFGYKSSQYFSNIERQLCSPSPTMFKKLSKILKIELDELKRLAIEDFKRDLERKITGKEPRPND